MVNCLLTPLIVSVNTRFGPQGRRLNCTAEHAFEQICNGHPVLLIAILATKLLVIGICGCDD